MRTKITLLSILPIAIVISVITLFHTEIRDIASLASMLIIICTAMMSPLLADEYKEVLAYIKHI